MSSYTDKVGSKLNELLERTYDAEKGFKKAAENAKHDGLRRYFEQKAKERYDFGHELKSEIRQFGQEVDKGDSFTAKAHRAWMDIKAAVSGDNEEAMLEEAIRGEKAAVSTYDDVLSETDLPPSTQTVLATQKQKIQDGLNTIKRLEDLR